MEQRTVASLIDTHWTRRRDGAQIIVRQCLLRHDRAVTAQDMLLVSNSAQTRHWGITYAGLTRRYTEDSRAFADELDAVVYDL